MRRRGVQTFAADHESIMQVLAQRWSAEARRWSISCLDINPFGISMTSAATKVAQEAKVDSQRYRSSLPRQIRLRASILHSRKTTPSQAEQGIVSYYEGKSMARLSYSFLSLNPRACLGAVEAVTKRVHCLSSSISITDRQVSIAREQCPEAATTRIIFWVVTNM